MRKYYREIQHPDSLLIVPDSTQAEDIPRGRIIGGHAKVPVIGVSISGKHPPQRMPSLLIHLEEDCQELTEAVAVALYPAAATVR